jgi:cytidylate kinase
MSSVNPIERFLYAKMYETRPSGEKTRPLIRPFVTISRQAGAGGHTLARTLLDVLQQQEDRHVFGGWEMFDQKLVAMVADDPDLQVSVESLLGERYHRAADDFFRQILTSTTHQDLVMDRVFRLVRLLAEVGKAVIVGRAGSEVTRGLGPSVSVRLVAPKEVRIERMMHLHGMDHKAARAATESQDEGRARLLRRHFRVDINDPLLYDATWNTALVPCEAIAESIIATLHHRVVEAEIVG